MIKRILIAVLFAPLLALAQTYPSPTVQNLTVLGTLTAPAPTFTSPLPVASGGTGSATASGTALDNISGFSGTGYVKRTGAGAYSFVLPIPVTDGGTGASSASGTALDNITGFNSTGFMSRAGAGSYTFSSRINLTNLANQAANTVVANVTSSSTTPTAFAMPSCSTSSSAVNYTTNTGFGCNSSINAAQLGGATFAAPGPIGSTTPSTGAFTTLSASTSLTAPTLALGTNTTGVATTAFVANHSPCVNIMDYGGNNTASANNDTAYQSAITANTSTSQICVYFPAGTYNFSSNAAYTFPNASANIVIKGAGQEATILQWAAGGGMTFNYKIAANTVTIEDLTVATGTTNTGSGIYLNQTAVSIAASATNTIQNVTVRGSDGFYGTDYWVNAINVNGVSNVNFVGVTIAGTSGTVHGVGINLGSTILGIVYNLTNVNIVGMNYGLVYGNNVQGVQITNANFTGNNIGVFVPSSLSNLSELSVIGSQFSNATSDIDITSGIPGVLIHANAFLVRNNANSLQISPLSHTSIVGNLFMPNSGSPSNLNGIALGGWAVGGTVITGNEFYSLTTAVTLTSTAKEVNVNTNVYVGNATSVSNSGGAACPPTSSGNCVGTATP